ncbi:hypothetical protein [Methanorbis furvi]|uniref:Uncharacterized protein n=1 Tax=Methanorbis furvi TaxID=3028299 RepID=A0AAE4SBI5_9EURY|nr:hypothetical protein [Methanocorpusculaceae archaeon Ag1]
MSEDDSRDKLQMDKYVVAYLDLLGSTSKIISEKSDNYLNDIRKIYENTYTLFKKEFPESLANHSPSGDFAPSDYFMSEGVQIKIFSDNILFALRISDRKYDAIKATMQLIVFISMYQSYLLLEGKWLLRGGLTAGRLHIDETFVWGPALVRAHILEEMAVVPRVLVDEFLIKIFPYLNPETSTGKIQILRKMDEIPQCFIDYECMFAKQNIKSGNKRGWLLRFKEELPGLRDEFLTKYDILDDIGCAIRCHNTIPDEADIPSGLRKIQWAINYHNLVCDELNELDLKIS